MLQSSVAAAARPPSLWLRVAAMIYELVLVFALAFVVGYGLLFVLGWTYPLPPARRWALQGVLFVAVGLYFCYCWVRGGQTLAMKSWGLRLESPRRPLDYGRAALRYLLAWHLLLPSMLFVTLFQQHALVDFAAFLLGLVLMLLTVFLDPGRQFLHDRLLGTRVVRSPR